MHATIAWDGVLALNVAQAAGDIVAVLTGETDKNNLSVMNSPGGTTIASSYPAGWTVWDDDTGTANEWVLRAPTVDDATQYKYVKLRFAVLSAQLQVNHQVMEDWNPTTNTPTNACTEHIAAHTRFPTNTYGNGTTELMATARYIMIRSNDYTFNLSIPCMEITRIHPSLEIGSGRVPAVQMSINMFAATNLSTYNASIPRILDDAGTADLTGQVIRCTNGGGRSSTNVTNEFDNFTSDVAYDSSSNISYGIQQILFERRDLVGGVIGDSIASDVYIGQGEVVTGFEDRTLHTLDTTDDRRCMWYKNTDITSHGTIRFFIKAE